MNASIAPADLVSQIAKKIIERAELNALPQQILEEYQERLAIEIQRRIGLVSLKMLDEGGRRLMNEWSKTAKPTPEAIAAFFQQNVPDYETRLAEEIEKFALELAANLRNRK